MNEDIGCSQGRHLQICLVFEAKSLKDGFSLSKLRTSSAEICWKSWDHTVESTSRNGNFDEREKFSLSNCNEGKLKLAFNYLDIMSLYIYCQIVAHKIVEGELQIFLNWSQWTLDEINCRDYPCVPLAVKTIMIVLLRILILFHFKAFRYCWQTLNEIVIALIAKSEV